MNDGRRAHAGSPFCFAHYSQSTTYFEMAEPTPAIAPKSKAGENPTQSQNHVHLASQKILRSQTDLGLSRSDLYSPLTNRSQGVISSSNLDALEWHHNGKYFNNTPTTKSCVDCDLGFMKWPFWIGLSSADTASLF